MSEWPSWIQSVAAIVQAVAAAFIFMLTRDYVRITRDISAANTEQLKLTRINQLAETKQRAGGLRGRASSLEVRVSALPEEPHDTAFRQRAIWTYDEIGALQSDAAGVLGAAAEEAAKAAVELTWLRERLQEVRDTSLATGYDYNRLFPADEWRNRRATALMHLRALMRYGEIVSEQSDRAAKQVTAGAEA